MIARIWHGMVPVSKADEYLGLMRRIALPEYQAIPGNRAAWCLYREANDVRHFQMLTFWDDLAAVRRFAGECYQMAKYYDFDPDYLIELEPHVRHYEVDPSNHAAAGGSNSPGTSQDGMIARLWRGVVPVEKAEAYARYLREFGLRDYQQHPGNRAAHLLCHSGTRGAHFLLLSFWKSREAIADYAGANIDQARYYPYDLECLIDPGPRVEHYEVSEAPRAEAASPAQIPG